MAENTQGSTEQPQRTLEESPGGPVVWVERESVSEGPHHTDQTLRITQSQEPERTSRTARFNSLSPLRLVSSSPLAAVFVWWP